LFPNTRIPVWLDSGAIQNRTGITEPAGGKRRTFLLFRPFQLQVIYAQVVHAIGHQCGSGRFGFRTVQRKLGAFAEMSHFLWILHLGIMQGNIAQGDVLQGASVRVGEQNASARFGNDIVDLHPADNAGMSGGTDTSPSLFRFVPQIDMNGAVEVEFVVIVADQIADHDIFKGGPFEIVNADRPGGVVHYIVGKRDLPHVLVGFKAAQFQPHTIGFHGAVGDGDPLRTPGMRHGFDAERVVPAGDVTVADHDIPAAADVKGIGVRSPEVVHDLHAVCMDPFAVKQFKGPAGRVAYGEAFQTQVFTVHKTQHGAGALPVLVGPPMFVHGTVLIAAGRIPEGFAVSIDDARSADDDPVRLVEQQQMPVLHGRVVKGIPRGLGDRTVKGIVLQMWRAQKDRSRHQDQFGVRMHLERTGEKGPGRHYHLASA